MMDRIDFHQQAQHLQSTDAFAAFAEANGQFKGQKVAQQKDAASMVQDAAEEMTFQASEKVEKKLGKRRAAAKGIRTTALEKAEFYLKKIRDMDKPEKMNKFMESMKRMAKNMNPQQLRQEVQRHFKDPSQQFAALAYAKEMMTQEPGNEGVGKAFQDAMDHMMDESGPEIRAGFNVTDDAMEFSAKGLKDTQQLRDFYRDTVLKYEGFHETYNEILEQYGETEFGKAIDFLIKAVGSELQSKGPSITHVELKRIIDDLYSLEMLGNIHRNCDELLEKIRKAYRLALKMNTKAFMGRLMGLKSEKWLRMDHVAKLVAQLGCDPIEAQIYFLREMGTLIKDLPLKIFEEDMEKREKLIDVTQEALDDAIDREEEMLEEEDDY
ncbi:type III secretion system gatekeeper subunit SctW [Acanthopleuribacter pedis]|uniref:Type III secretion system gatekeeper subunit SctW n=1 Tax=Acanthopleuribacter pedis TaxID=442870 RepID=A0A8J7U742_9BACT|nr:type III secretion system gatekeeper subunit SctW [Acanthopleuribacter pedis]MBO1322604.1 type III secretion system gatekeeper subunit SctW [Acanthopleuribacter pedis]